MTAVQVTALIEDRAKVEIEVTAVGAGRTMTATCSPFVATQPTLEP